MNVTPFGNIIRQRESNPNDDNRCDKRYGMVETREYGMVQNVHVLVRCSATIFIFISSFN
jgi:hypothetical protein